VSSASVTLDFFETMGSPIIAGRGFDSRDLVPSTPVVVVNQSFVETALGGQQPLGRRVRYASPRSDPGSDDEPWHEIIGVVRDLGMGQSNALAGIYHPIAPAAAYGAHVAVHVTGDPVSFVPELYRITTAASPALRLEDWARLAGRDVMTLEDASRLDLIGPRVMFWLAFLVTVVAVALSLSGIYAIMSFTVWQRRREIALRMAVGSDAKRITAAILRRPLVQVGLGVLVGAGLIAVLAASGLGNALSGDGLALLTAYALFMAVVCLLASIAPIRHMLRVDPAVALKSDT
jgi:hypothetical protein